MRIIDERAKENIRPYLIQSGLATGTVLLILLFLDVIEHTAIIATLGSTAFLVFTRPRAYASRTRPLAGGYAVGIVVGAFFAAGPWAFRTLAWPVPTSAILIVFGAMAVGAAIFLMVVTNTEHPPAAGMSLGLVMNSWDLWTLVYVFAAIAFMITMRRILQRYMIDLI